jgi:hypothetical protein
MQSLQSFPAEKTNEEGTATPFIPEQPVACAAEKETCPSPKTLRTAVHSFSEGQQEQWKWLQILETCALSKPPLHDKPYSLCWLMSL